MECVHVDKNIDKSKQDLIKFSEGSCCVCKEPGPNLWACLKEGCQFVGCGESKNDHGSKHCEEHEHYVAVNLKSFRIWCYACQKEIHLRHYFIPDDMKRLKSAKTRKAIPGSACPASKINQAKKAKTPVTSPTPPPPSISYTSLSSLLLLTDEPDDSVELDATRGLTGLRNLGNTCYMNAALQSLSNCPQLSLYFMAMGKLLNSGQKLSMSASYLKLVNELWSPKRFSCVAPSSVHSTLRMVNSSFRSYQQQDTQEFLRCFMDRLHEELKFAVPVDDPHSLPQFQEAGDATTVLPIPRIVTPPPPSGEDTMSMTVSTSSEESFKSCHSMEVDVVEEDSISMDEDNEEQPMIERSAVTFPQELDQLHASASPLFRSTSMPSIATSNPPQQSPQRQSAARKRTVSSRSTTQIEAVLNTSGRVLRPPTKKKVYKHVSVISDIFDGEIRSSVQCRTCCSISHTRETFQDLSLPIPGKDETARLHGYPQNITLPMASSTPPPSGPCANTEGYQTKIYYLWDWLKSWFWGPDVNLSDCLAAFFSADELKGDNMYSCEKCKKLRNGVKYCRLLKLPEVLCIHLKRFRHEYLTSYSTKISSTVTYPLHGLDLSCYVAKDNVSENMVYDLSSVIIHHGGAGGGHYTSYCKNPLNGKWYEFDDQYVTQVSESTVAAAEAYVLFYNKRDEEARKCREQVISLDGAKEPVLMWYYVSVEWMLQFLTFAEPGPIDNSYFLCPHENLKPHLVDSVGERVCCVSEQTWRVMHERLGGGPAVTHLQPCATCIHEAKVLEERRLAEKEMYLKLSETSQELGKTSTYYIGMNWFRLWQNFIHAKEKEPPGEIDNQPIAVVRDGKYTLKKGGDYGEIAAEAWTYLLETYGGGPAIPNTTAIIYQNDTRCNNEDL